MTKSTITTIIIVIVLFIAGGYYFWSLGNTSSDTGGLTAASPVSGSTGSVVGADALALLSQVSNIKIHSEFFNSSVFTSLVDITQQVQLGTMYRQNPFAPVPGVPNPFNSSISQTQQPVPAVPSSQATASKLPRTVGTKTYSTQ